MKYISVMHNKNVVWWQYAEPYAEQWVFLPSRKEKRALFLMKLHVPLWKSQSLSSCKFSCPIADGLQKARSGARDGKISGLCHMVMECISNHQKVMPYDLSKAVVLANSLMLVLPLRVLAETCEAARNPFTEMPLLFAIALIGAAVGGLLARQRRGELERLNDQLRQINVALRRQAKIESYAPSLSYTPGGRISESEVIVDPRKQQLITILRTGKNFLRNQDLEKASVEFKAAFDLARSLGDHLEEKKAARGLGASLQRLGRYKEAIKYYSKVLEISRQEGDDSGSTEAYGAIADCYAELGELERAAKFYDKYIGRLESD
ncbi:protein FLUORESCENT IN BLUE LIGHT, chloroplastic isoform X2 [Elaeis guineensis]|uniref:Protein FLUORESCENT IN BLUE LIGHT, chloroplastic isoform X2 n=1 Tax=Elaeis guineensis var. tenera TaxID=51953 RepID=A0A8N4F472_ELAGV|nr:protein FLUORESCENT IN BLUE LIGHT, chloroplastic isoform X2 [Elaeis guineensis]